MIFERNERVKIVALENPMLPKSLLGSEGYVEEECPAGLKMGTGSPPFYWVRLDKAAGYFYGSCLELEFLGPAAAIPEEAMPPQ